MSKVFKKLASRVKRAVVSVYRFFKNNWQVLAAQVVVEVATAFVTGALCAA